MKTLFEENEFEFTEITGPSFPGNDILLSVARLDKIHPVVSGNKLFKLHYFLEQSLKESNKLIVSFGGAYSNHLAATAFACRNIGTRCIGIVRGEQPVIPSHTLKQCEGYGMELHFVSREEYNRKDEDGFNKEVQARFGDCIIIPEGGFHPLGAEGASLIMEGLKEKGPTHICTATGTATTLAGLLMASKEDQTIISIPVLKNMTDIHERINYLCGKSYDNLVILDGYHFGGYAKRTTQLIKFMNELFLQYQMPTDFVYTAKMMYAVMDKIKAGYFAAGSRITCLHTGGLQGNDSLPAPTLVF